MENEDIMDNKDVYTELCTSYHAIDSFRHQLLSFLPLASGGILAFLIDPKFLNCQTGGLYTQLLPGVGLLGFLVALGLFCFEIYGIRRCTHLIFVGAYIEWKSNIEHGQFRDRPPPVLGFIAEPMASGVIYPAVMAAWSYVAMYFYNGCSASIALRLAAGVFVIFAGFMVWYQERLKNEGKCWRKDAGMPEPILVRP